MSLKNNLKENFDNYEKGAIALSFFSVLIGFFFQDDQLSGFLNLLNLSGLFLLWFLYFSLSEPDFLRWPMGLLLFYVFSSLFMQYEWEGASTIRLLYLAAYPIFGGIILFRAIKDSGRNKNFELLSFLLGLFLTLAPVFDLIKNSELIQVKGYYHFALAFLIATILYNDNLWERYNFNGKNLLKYIFIITLIYILSSSGRFLSI